MNFKKTNNLVGGIVFFISLATYLLTAERDFSFWDVGEYIVSSAKLSITHAPGAATFQIFGAFLSSFVFGDGKLYSILINGMSGLFSALTILLLYHTLSHLLQRLVAKENQNLQEKTSLTFNQKSIVILASTIGALVYTFSDTFWFSAVEGEVYAMASFFVALSFWLICKWETKAEKPRNEKWLILISMLIGLGVGVHLITILVVPSIVLIYFFHKNNFTWKNFILANFFAFAVLVVVFKIIFPLTMTYFGKMEIFFVNGLRFPFHTGTIFGFATLILFFFLLLNITAKIKARFVHTLSLSVLYMLIGLLTWLVIPIRANANPPINLNNPDTAIGVLDYYNRVQYGDWPVLYGEMYTAYLEEGALSIEKGDPIYEKSEETRRYEIVGERSKYKASLKHVGFLPKLYNPDGNVMENYAQMVGYPEFRPNLSYARSEGEQAMVMGIYKEMQEKYNNGDIKISDYKRVKDQSRLDEPILYIDKPSFGQNLSYFLDFQVGYMFFRYLLWNFSGRQNDWEGQKEVTKGNWISGIDFIDNPRLGDQSLLPSEYKNNKANNHYYMLPFILGIIGLLFHTQKDISRSYALFILFSLSSFGIIMYTSVKPFEPRERDYAVVASFYVFAIWVGIGVYALYDLATKHLKNNIISLILPVLCLAVPFLMATQNWDDHNRSKRKAAYDLAKNYMKDLDENSILFVYGDNDTYPLWALQETENYRDDVKVVNFTLIGSPWNISQVKRRTYNAAALPGNLEYPEYKQGKNDQILVLSKEQLIQRINDAGSLYDNGMLSLSDKNNILKLEKYIEKESISAKEAMDFIRSKNPEKLSFLKMYTNNPEDGDLNFLPINKIHFVVDKKAVKANKIVAKEDYEKIIDTVKINIESSTLFKGELTMLDMMSEYNWERPIYFSGGGLYNKGNQLYLTDYLQFEGFYYKFVPILTPDTPYDYTGHLNSTILAKKIRNYGWSNFNHPNAYFDETAKRNVLSYLTAVDRCVEKMIAEGKEKESKELLLLAIDKIPFEQHTNLLIWNQIASKLEILGMKEEMNFILNGKTNVFREKMKFYESLEIYQQNTIIPDLISTRQSYLSLINTMILPHIEEGKENNKAKIIFNSLFSSIVKNTNEYLLKLKSTNGELPKNQIYIVSERYKMLNDLESIANTIDEEFYKTLGLEELKKGLEFYMGKRE